MNDNSRSYSLAKTYIILLLLGWAYFICSGVSTAVAGRGGEAMGAMLIFLVPVWLFCSLGAISYGWLLRRKSFEENHRRFGGIALIVGVTSLLAPIIITFVGMIIVTMTRV